MLELAENLTVRAYRLEARYTATRLAAYEETRSMSKDFEEAADKLAVLEDEGAQLEVRRIEAQALVETADDAWDEVAQAFQRRLLELSNHDTDQPLYRRYFAELPSKVTNLSYHAEILVSKDLEAELGEEPIADLAEFKVRLTERREPLERLLVERTRLEVEEARYANRVAMAKTILNKLRRVTFSHLEEIAIARSRGGEWCLRFFHGRNTHLDALTGDGVETSAKSSVSQSFIGSEAPEALA